MSQEGRDSIADAAAPAASFTVQFEDGGPSFCVPADQPLLHAAAQAGVPVSYTHLTLPTNREV